MSTRQANNLGNAFGQAQPIDYTHNETCEYANVAEFTCGIDHASIYRFQIDDDNECERQIRVRQQGLNRERGENAQSGQDGKNSPHDLGKANAPWHRGEDEGRLAFFSSPTPKVGKRHDDGHFEHYYDQHITAKRRADDIDKYASTAAKFKVVVEKRDFDMEHIDGGRQFWTPARDGTRREGTFFKVDCSYVENRAQLISYLNFYLARIGVDYRISNDDIIEGTFRRQFESHHRFDRGKLQQTVETLRQIHKLLEDDTEQDGKWKKNKNGYQIWAFSVDDLEPLGFDFDHISGDDVYIKAYMVSHPPSDPNHPAHHPKLEVRSQTTHAGEDIPAVRAELNTLLATLCHWATIETDDLIDDTWYKPDERPTITYKRPEMSRQRLREKYESENYKREVEYVIHEANTKTYHDILAYLLFNSRDVSATYDDLIRHTGLQKSGIRSAVNELIERKILRRTRGEYSTFEFQNGITVEVVDGAFDHSKTMEEREKYRKRRKRENIQDYIDTFLPDGVEPEADDLAEMTAEDIKALKQYNKTDRDGDDEEETADAPGTDEPAPATWPAVWPGLDEAPLSMAHLYKMHSDGDITDEDVKVNPKKVFDSPERYERLIG